ncbi:MAG TPA: DUF2961 domain-containing protein [Candidatus Sumerlaeota bacterium]|nr:DUF2961 domain-containing protein [Candidatus Sumerlaeota bacterium]
MAFDGLNLHLGNLSRLSDAESRSLSAENPTGARGQGGMAPEENNPASKGLGQGWKCRPCVSVPPGETLEIASIDGPGAIQQMWFTINLHWRHAILRIYWDGQQQPSVECPMGDFFCSGWGRYAQVSSLAVCVNPGSAFNCYWEMPFRKHCRITVENLNDEWLCLFYQINYTLTRVPDDAAYFHAQFRRTNPVPYQQVHAILDGVRGRGHYVGTYMAWGVNNNGWWGEGEVKFYLDGDGEFPTICGTGTEDYFCGSYNFENQATHQYQEFTTPYAGMPQVIRPDGLYSSQQRFSLYRWHVTDPIRFKQDLRVTVQALGWRNGCKRYLPLRDDLASVAFWYQTLPTAPFPPLPDKDALEVI